MAGNDRSALKALVDHAASAGDCRWVVPGVLQWMD